MGGYVVDGYERKRRHGTRNVDWTGIAANCYYKSALYEKKLFSRLIVAFRIYAELIEFGFDLAIAMVGSNNEYKIVRRYYVLRVGLIAGKIKINVFEDGDIFPLKNCKGTHKEK